MPIMSRDKVLDKIRKLIALSGSSNVHEAEVAAAAAQRLMLEYKVAESDISFEASDEDLKVEQEVYRDLSLKAPPRWHGILLNGIANANFCKLLLGVEYTRKGWEMERRKIYRIIGTDHDRATVKYLYEMLRLEIERLCESAALYRAYDRAERASFKLGAASSLASRLAREYRAFTSDLKSDEKTQALAVIDKATDAVDRFMGEHFPRVRASRSVTASRHAAYLHGREAGDGVDIAPSSRRLDVARKALHDGSAL